MVKMTEMLEDDEMIRDERRSSEGAGRSTGHQASRRKVKEVRLRGIPVASG
jgi:hypothetical protein